MTTTATEIIERVKRLSPAQVKELRQRLDAMAAARKRAAAEAAVKDYLRRQRNGQRREEIEQEPIEEMIDQPTAPHKDRTGGERRPAGYLRGVPFYDSEDGATWD